VTLANVKYAPLLKITLSQLILKTGNFNILSYHFKQPKVLTFNQAKS